MALNLIQGTVQTFGTSGANYGFIVYDDKGRQKRLFFHSHAMRFLKGEAGKISWTPVPEGIRLRNPKEGDILVFEIGSDRQDRPCADPWTFVQVKAQAEKDAAKPVAEPTRYRYMYRSKMVSGEWSKPTKQWEGTDPNDSSLRPYWDPQFRKDFSHDDGWSAESWFQSSTDGGKTWANCQEPLHLMKNPRRRY
jgi:hypothetical protein